MNAIRTTVLLALLGDARRSHQLPGMDGPVGAHFRRRLERMARPGQ